MADGEAEPGDDAGLVYDPSRGFATRAALLGIARGALQRYAFAPDSEVRLLDLSENATFLVQDAHSGERAILRVHRLGYHSPQAVSAELAWLTALRTEAGVRTPRVIAGRDDEQITLHDPGDGLGPRMCVAFEFLPGGPPAQDRLPEEFETLGAITARMHQHARGWARPAGFTRFSWTFDDAFGPQARWGRWADAPGVGPAECAQLTRLQDALAQRLRAFGREPVRFGLIHADLRLANLIADGDRVAVIDFDDCGFGWYLYDLGTAVSFIEHEPQVPELINRWLIGYRSVADFGADEREAWTFVMFRRLLLTAWIGSHSTVAFAAQLGAGYTSGTCELAEQYLAGALG